MCRFILYQGPPLRIAALVAEPENSLIHQSVHSRERKEPVNGDGFGLAWYPPNSTEPPARFRSITPAWNNANLLDLARVIESRVILAHVRAASQARSVAETNCHPFKYGPYTFMHNGDVGGFGKVRRALLSELSDEAFDSIQGGTDTEHAFALLLDRLRPFGVWPTVDQMIEALGNTIARLVELVAERVPGVPSFMNFALSNGRSSVVTRFTTKPGYDGESLHLHHGRRYVCEAGACRMLEPNEEGGAFLVSSERLSADPGWETIPRNSLVAIGEDGAVRRTKL